MGCSTGSAGVGKTKGPCAGGARRNPGACKTKGPCAGGAVGGATGVDRGDEGGDGRGDAVKSTGDPSTRVGASRPRLRYSSPCWVPWFVGVCIPRTQGREGREGRKRDSNKVQKL
uniref:Uncharacterized protein n=1 Tax=viral metagenome TaxID=1070528 RepID=A0A6C0LHQ1_9ZZZZ